eukprot:Lithocolla_globosa_v1_NODE_2929_length_1820_cov_1388.899717.p2 type:complete len:185 gc:universal NODE_2929_length_1820_cov_1388.899717:1047-493(-)
MDQDIEQEIVQEIAEIKSVYPSKARKTNRKNPKAAENAAKARAVRAENLKKQKELLEQKYQFPVDMNDDDFSSSDEEIVIINPKTKKKSKNKIPLNHFDQEKYEMQKQIDEMQKAITMMNLQKKQKIESKKQARRQVKEQSDPTPPTPPNTPKSEPVEIPKPSYPPLKAPNPMSEHMKMKILNF